MPYIQISVSRALADTEKQSLRACALDAAALLNKSRAHVMVHILDNQALTKGDEPGDCAFCDVRVLGAATKEACDLFSQTLSADIARIVKTAPMSVYLSLSEMSLCYTDGKLPPVHGH
ncbi:MAG: hypothetical protein LLF96_09865 [Eubacteriales bacterium]|nr:hypothetical protein [Eubacteriales bacterium]